MLLLFYVEIYSITHVAHIKRYDQIKKEFPDILKAHCGLIGKSCQAAQISMETYYRWRRESAEFAKKCDECEIVTGWMVKDKLVQKIIDGDVACIIFYCKTKLKHEGFVERVEATGKDGGAIEFTRKLSEEEQAFFEERLQIERDNILKERDMQQLEMKVVSEHNEPSGAQHAESNLLA